MVKSICTWSGRREYWPDRVLDWDPLSPLQNESIWNQLLYYIGGTDA